MNNMTKITTLLFCILSLFACQNRNNLSEIFPDINMIIDSTRVELSDIFTISADSLSNLNAKLILGNHEGIDSRILLRFDFTNVDSMEVIEDAILNFRVINRLNKNDLNISYGALTADFAPTSIKYEDIYNEFTEAHLTTTFPADSDSLNIAIKKEIINDWIIDKDKNHGLILFITEPTDSFIEFFSRTTVLNQPSLKVKLQHKSKEEPEPDRYYLTTANAFVHDAKDKEESLYLRNIYPNHIYTYFDITPKLFNLKPEETAKMKQINIVQAYLDLPVISADNITSKSDNPTSDNRILLTPSLPNDKVEEGNKFSDIKGIIGPTGITIRSTSADSTHSIRITATLQRIVSNPDKNHGILLINNTNNRDFSYIKFHDLQSDKKPIIRVIYSKLKDEE